MAQRTDTSGDGTMGQTSTTGNKRDAMNDRTSSRPIERKALLVPERRKRRWWWAIVVVLAAGAAGVWLFFSDGGSVESAASPTELSFNEVVLADLIEQESYDATLGTTAADLIRSQASGTVTSVADPGTTLSEGDVVFSIDGEPVVMLNGEVPAWRDLATVEQPTAPGLTNGLSGTVTRVAEPGTFEQGDIIYWVNEEPVVLLNGLLPQYRSLSQPNRGDVSGPDVVQLKQALTALGYDSDGIVGQGETFGSRTEDMVEAWQEDIGATVDGTVNMGEIIYVQGPVEVTEFLIEVGDSVSPGQDIADQPDLEEEIEVLEGADVLQLEAALARLGFDASGALVVDGVWDEATEIAVTSWQEAVGAEADGAVDLGDVVFQSSTIRVLDQLSPVGSSINAGAAVLEISSAEKLVTMNLPAADQGIVEAGDSVTVELADGSGVGAVVIDVASIATVANNNTVFEVTIALDNPAAAAGLDEAPVDVLIVTDSAPGVMAVPVTALLVLAEGGYAVEVDDGAGGTDYVGVEPGFFADGLVEVTASGLSIGDRVVVP